MGRGSLASLSGTGRSVQKIVPDGGTAEKGGNYACYKTIRGSLSIPLFMTQKAF
jgi:hypothetical protein